jgi:hypothetical protein
MKVPKTVVGIKTRMEKLRAELALLEMRLVEMDSHHNRKRGDTEASDSPDYWQYGPHIDSLPQERNVSADPVHGVVIAGPRTKGSSGGD